MNKLNNTLNLSVNPLVGLPLSQTIKHTGESDLTLDTLLNSINTKDTNKTLSRKYIKKNINKLISYNQEFIENKDNQWLNKEANTFSLTNLSVSNQELRLNTLEENNRDITIKSENKIQKKYFLKTIVPFNEQLASYNQIVYNFNKKNNQMIKNIYSIIESAFYSISSLISKPIYFITPNNIKIQLFFYWNPLNKSLKKSKTQSKFLILNQIKLDKLASFLSKIFKKEVDIELTRLYYPYSDSNILANLIGLFVSAKRFRRFRNTIFQKAKIKNPTRMTKRISNTLIPSFISGLKLKLAGRVLSKNMNVRVKSKTIQRGTLARTKANLVNSSRFTHKNRRGAFSITVTAGHLIVQ